MSVSIAVKEMTYEEKIQTMELIWDDLCHSSDEFKSPAWHKNILSAREEAIEKGEDKFIDWDIAKQNIDNATK
jgi:hypothetical protein